MIYAHLCAPPSNPLGTEGDTSIRFASTLTIRHAATSRNCSLRDVDRTARFKGDAIGDVRLWLAASCASSLVSITNDGR
jgi:hypothetical protein